MPKNYFQYLPTTEYQINGKDSAKLVVDILRRIKVRDELILDGAVFYNYQMQEGDTVEIIADKYYGSTQYHWVVMLMNSAQHHIYDFALSGDNFERFVNDKYGSIPRADGVTKTISDTTTYSDAGVSPEWYSKEQDQHNNANIESGTAPAGNSTAIYVQTSKLLSPFANIDVGDEIRIFIPEGWYDLTANTATKIPWSMPAKVIGRSTRINVSSLDNRKHYINTNMNSNTYDAMTWTVNDDITIRTGIHHFEMDVYDASGTVLLANNVQITQAEYVNNSIGTSPTNTKTIVSNHAYEIESNEDHRNISLLKRELLVDFIAEFEKLAAGR
jgi:hypothetical protein